MSLSFIVVLHRESKDRGLIIFALGIVMNAGMLYGLDPKILSSEQARFTSISPSRPPLRHQLIPPDVLNNSSGMNWNTLHHNPVKGINPNASSA